MSNACAGGADENTRAGGEGERYEARRPRQVVEGETAGLPLLGGSIGSGLDAPTPVTDALAKVEPVHAELVGAHR